MDRLSIQLWTAHYEPQPSGIAPVAGTMARALRERGIDVSVVAAHPFYPDPSAYPRARLAEHTLEDGIPVTRLPIYRGRRSVGARVAQEASWSLSLLAYSPRLSRPQVLLAISPFFLSLIPAMSFARVRRVPWVLWLQDVLPDGATATGMVEEGLSVSAARRLERAAYRSAERIVVIGDSFTENLTAKGVPVEKIARVYNPATAGAQVLEAPHSSGDGRTVITMGNIGFSQNLEAVVEAFEADSSLEARDARLMLIGDGAAAPAVRTAVRGDRVLMPGFIERERLDRELDAASLALVSQRYPREALDFNVPSKLMNFMARGMPVVAAVRPHSEVARIIERSGCGWVVDAERLEELGPVILRALENPEERLARGERGRRFAQVHFEPNALAGTLAELLGEVAGTAGAGTRRG